VPSSRVRGSEVSILLTQGSELLEFNRIRNFTFAIKGETTEEGYLGEKSNRTDDNFNSVGGDLELHVENSKWITFAKAVSERQKRNVPDTVFNISAVTFYTDGSSSTLIARDVKWGEIPFGASSRKDFVTVKLTWVADDFDLQT
jgi:hypothetical protein